jgi:hypothetical protein
MKNTNIFKSRSNNMQIKNKGFNMVSNDFPEMISNNSHLQPKVNNLMSLSFIEKLKIEKKRIIDDKIYINPGWVLLQKDKLTNNIIYTENNIKQEDNGSKELYSIVSLYNNRKQLYINMWGEDEYNNMFIFPNYDYEYFDKLDEICYMNNCEQDESDCEEEIENQLL